MAPSFPADGETVHRRLTFGLQALMAVGLGLSVVAGQWLNALVIGGILVLTALPFLLSRRFQVYVPPEVELLAVLFVFLSLFLGWTQGYYLRFPWWDAALHAGSGFLLGVFGFLLVYGLNQDPHAELRMKPGFIALFSFTFAVAAGAAWEVFEYAMDAWFDAGMQWGGLRDTMWDLIVDMGGALVVALLGRSYLKTEEDSFLERWIADFVRRNPRLFADG